MNGNSYRDGDLVKVAMSLIEARTARDLALDSQHPNFKKLEKFLNKVRVVVQTGPGGQRSRIKTIRGLEPMVAEFKFTNSENRTMTVKVRITFFPSLLCFKFRLFLDFQQQDHFHEAYNRTLKHSRIVGIRLSPKSGRDDIVPLELCSILPGQLYRRKLPEDLTGEMVKFSAVKPQERQQLIRAEVSLCFSHLFFCICANKTFVIISRLIISGRSSLWSPEWSSIVSSSR